MAADRSTQALVDLGFTALEAEVYTALVRESPSTGYRVARAVGRPPANVYRTIHALEGKGAVLKDEGAARLYRAVPAEELLGRLARTFDERRKRASEELARLRSAPEDDRVYLLTSRDQVFERARQMLAGCLDVAVVDAFPLPLEVLRDDLEAAAARGVTTAVGVYAPARVAGALTFVQPHGASILERWPGHWINVVVDGSETLLAFLDAEGDGVHQALWSGSAYLSSVYHSAVTSELILGDVQQRIADGVPHARLLRRLNGFRSRLGSQGRGYEQLRERFGAPAPGGAPPARAKARRAEGGA